MLMRTKHPFKLKQASVRLVKERPLLSETPVETPYEAARVLKGLISDFDRETVCVVSLRNDLCPINFFVCSIGSINLSVVEPREMIKALCLSNATSFLMMHNHPGGSLQPSKMDAEITDRMLKLGSLLHIPLLDHIIVAPGTDRFFSFKDRGVLTFEAPKMETDYREIRISALMAAEGGDPS